MQIELPFDAALILEQTDLKRDQPDVWRRYLDNRHIRYSRRIGARVFTSVGRADLKVIRDYYCLWLQYESLLAEDEQNRVLVCLAQDAVRILTAAIDVPSPSPRRV